MTHRTSNPQRSLAPSAFAGKDGGQAWRQPRRHASRCRREQIWCRRPSATAAHPPFRNSLPPLSGSLFYPKECTRQEKSDELTTAAHLIDMAQKIGRIL